MKKVYCLILTFILSVLPTMSVFAQQTNKQELITVLENQNRLIKDEVDLLEQCNVDVSNIEKVVEGETNNQYVMNYDGVYETVIIDSSNTENTTLTVLGKDKKNVVSVSSNGDVILDGKKVEIASEVSASSRATIWKGTKSLIPYGTLKASDYNDLLTSKKQNVALGKAIDQLTITALSAIIGSLHGYLGIAVSLAGIAQNVYTVIENINPKTEYLGCICTTYTADASNYKYINKFYANSACTGKYCQEISYEHFVVY